MSVALVSNAQEQRSYGFVALHSSPRESGKEPKMAATKKTATTKMTKDQMESKMAEMMAMMAEMSKALEATNARALAAEAKNAELATELAKTPAQRRVDEKAKVEAEVQREAFIDKAVAKALSDLHGAVAHRFYSERKGNNAQRLGELDYEVEEANWVYEKVLMESANPDREAARQAVAFVLPSIDGGGKKPRAGKGGTGRRSARGGNRTEVTERLTTLNSAGFDRCVVAQGRDEKSKKFRYMDGTAMFALTVQCEGYKIEVSQAKAEKLEGAGFHAYRMNGKLSCYMLGSIQAVQDVINALTA